MSSDKKSAYQTMTFYSYIKTSSFNLSEKCKTLKDEYSAYL